MRPACRHKSPETAGMFPPTIPRPKPGRFRLSIIFWTFMMIALPHPQNFGLALDPLSAPASGQPVVCLIRLAGSINPGSAQYLKRAIETSRSEGAACLIVELDTPGGLVSTLRDMIQAVMASPVPLVVYVAPSGAQAASAGALLTISADVAAMAPGTNMGAAHPVGIGESRGKDSVMDAKAENDLAAMARSIATERGKNASWAEDAVRRSVSATEKEALELGVIDMIARDTDDLILKLGPRIGGLSGGKKPRIVSLEPSLREKVLSTIADPNIAYLLMMAGIVGIYFELAHPGTIFPGTVGAISLLLGLFALQALPVNATGLLLILLSALLLVLELFITSYGLLGVSGFISLLLGSLMLFDTGETGIELAREVLVSTLLVVGCLVAAIIFLAGRAGMARARTGAEGLVGETGTVREKISKDQYKVFVHGEVWNARSLDTLEPDTHVVVTGVKGLTLDVKQAKGETP